jgi:ubiquinone biosynthesis protein UbiJ
MDETHIYVDSKTFNELSDANGELVQYLQWLIKRKDLEAIKKLMPIVGRMTDLFTAILEGAFPEISRVANALNRLRGEITERIAHASSTQEIERLSKEVDELTRDYRKLIDEVMAKAKRLEKQSRK